MVAPQGLAHFDGIDVIQSATFTLTDGITPSSGTIVTVPHSQFLSEVGDLVFSFAGQEVVRLRDCAIDRPSLKISPQGYIWSLRIVDRRWRWKHGDISGRWNQKDRPVKQNQELAELLLRAMGVSRFDISAVPNNTLIEVEWDANNPAQELAKLCERIGCRIVLTLDDVVRIVPIGQGQNLPETGAEMTADFGFVSSLAPDRVKLVMQPTLWQSKLKLEAVGEETDGSIKRIDDLSYKPEAGWAGQWGKFFADVTATYKKDGVDKDAIDLANRDVFKLYRVTSQANGEVGVPGAGFEGKVTNISQIYPILPNLLTFKTNELGIRELDPAQVDGVFWEFNELGQNTAAGTPYPGDFLVSGDNGLVRFNEAVVKLNDDGIEQEAELYLTASYNARDNVLGGLFREEVERNVQGANRGTGAKVVRSEITQRQIIQNFAGPIAKAGVADNLKAQQDLAGQILNNVLAQFALKERVEMEYAGIWPIETDGAIQQVTWTVGISGATTRASRNDEYNNYSLSREERERRELVERIKDEVQV